MNKLFRLLFVFGMFCTTFPVFADRYNQLWQQVEESRSKDLPQTSLKQIDQIISLARQKGHGGHLMKALLVKYQLHQDISPDSANAYIPIIKMYLERESSSVMKSLYHVALGALYRTLSVQDDKNARKKSVDYFTKAMHKPSVLFNAKAHDYIPFIIIGEDSHYYNDDLLNILAKYSAKMLKNLRADAQAQDIFHQEISSYHYSGMLEAEFFAILDSADVFLSFSQKEKFYKNVIQRFANIEVCSEAYLRLAELQNDTMAYRTLTKAVTLYPNSKIVGKLQNRINVLQQPSLNVSLSQKKMIPFIQGKVTIEGRNMTKGSLVFYKTNYTAQSKDIFSKNQEAWKAQAKVIAKEIPFTLPQGQPAQWTKSELEFSLSSPGIYLVQLKGVGVTSPLKLLYVTSLHVMNIFLPNKSVRVVVSEAESGRPIPDARVILRSADKENTLYKTLTTDINGELLISPNDQGQKNIFPVIEGDEYCPGLYLNKNFYIKRHTDVPQTLLQLYTDRAIYRPGQTVHVGGFMYEKNRDDVNIVADREVKLQMFDVNRKELASNTLVTDSFGAIKTSFVLPEHCLNGTFNVQGDIDGFVSFKVEEYRRPTFTVLINDVTSSYVAGDTVLLNGEVKTYSGFAVANAHVAYSVRRSEAFWFNYRLQSAISLSQDTVLTNEQGHFQIPVTLTIGEDVNPHFYQFSCDVRVTTENGETEVASTTLHVGNRPATLSTTLPDRICKEHACPFVIAQKNMQGNELLGKAKVKLYKGTKLVKEIIWELNVPLPAVEITKLSSGHYHMMAVPLDRNDSLVVLRHKFFVFSLKDKKVDEQPLLVYATNDTFSQPVSVFVGTSSSNVYLHYDCFADDKLVESKLLKLNNGTVLLNYHYDKSYEDGLQAVFTYVKDGKNYTESVMIKKPLPDKRLQLRWTSFRNKLYPGQKETWTLQVLRHGKPVAASMIASLYDASLDKLCKRDWNFGIQFARYIRQYQWNYNYKNSLSLSVQERIRTLKTKSWDFSHFNEALLMFYPSMTNDMIFATTASSSIPARNISIKMMKSAAVPQRLGTEEISRPIAGLQLKEEKPTSFLRSDFNETAFFCSGLMTDAQGETRLTFHLPQSLTQWSFHAVAHDKVMNHGLLDTMVVASKDFMVQANIPRFVRVGDKVSIVVTVRNASELSQTGILSFDVLDPATMKIIHHSERLYDVAVQKEENLIFDIQPTSEYPLLICRCVARGNRFSDGEQYYLPVLEDLQQVTETYPLTLTHSGEYVVEIADTTVFRKPVSSHRQLMVEYTANPVWTAVESLPSVMSAVSWNAHALSSSFYALTLAAMEAQRHPEIMELSQTWRASGSVDSVYMLLKRNAGLKQIVLNETPWVASADAECSRLENLSQLFDTVSLSLKRLSYLDRLLDLQSPAGGWSWYKGMSDNLYMTIDVVEMLARLNTLAPSWIPEKVQNAMSSSFLYMDKEVSDWIDEYKRIEKRFKIKMTVPHTLLRYLYIAALMNRPANSNVAFLLNRLEKSAPHYDMYSKALAARVLASYFKKRAAKVTLQSLMEHTVCSPMMGRYFDTRRAPSFYESYRIPTQVAAMEAIDKIGMYVTQLKEMQQWLLQSKRTQSWNNPRVAVDAIYYLFSMDKNRLDTRIQVPQITVFYPDGTCQSALKSSDMKECKTLGYICKPASMAQQIPSKVVFNKSDDQMSFAAVYAQYTVPVSEVQKMSSGLSLQCFCEVQRGSIWQEISSSTILHKGDVVRFRYDITADRDYDFVSFKAGKAACLEPQNALSGYTWRSGCYRENDDVSIQYFFDQLSKGKHVLYETFNVDRAGVYTTAAPVIQCAYAPEFSAISAAQMFNVK